MTTRATLFLLAIMVLALPASARPDARPGTSVYIENGGSVRVDPPGLTVKVEEQVAGKNAKLHLTTSTGSRVVALAVGGDELVGDYAVHLQAVAKLCQFVVWYRPPASAARTLMASYGWHPLAVDPQHIKLDVPKGLGGPAFTHYETASEQLGMSLADAQGLTVDLQRFTMQEKTKEGQSIYAFLAVKNQRIIGAWVSSDAPVAPGIVPLNGKVTW